MNNESPLVPQGSLLEQKNKGRARVKIAVFVVLAIHGLGLLALLMQGCKPNVPSSQETAQETLSNTPPPFQETTNPPAPAETNPVAAVEPPATNVTPAPEPLPQLPLTTAPALPGSATEYKIVKGDNFSKIAKQFHVSVKMLADANPGVDSTKLHIGQTLRVPPSSATGPAGTGTIAGTPGPASATGAEQAYTVKSGDSLTKIAREFGTTVKAVRAANNLKTDRIKVGQKLNVPTKSSAASPAAPVPSAPAPAPDTGSTMPSSTPPPLPTR